MISFAERNFYSYSLLSISGSSFVNAMITSDSRQPRTGSDELLKASCQGNFLILTHLSWIHHPEFLTTWVDHVADWLRPRDLTKVLAGECVQRHVATVIHQPQVLGANLLNISNLIRRQ